MTETCHQVQNTKLTTTILTGTWPTIMDTYFIKCSSVTHESANIANIFNDSKTISSFAFGSSFYNEQFFFKISISFF